MSSNGQHNCKGISNTQHHLYLWHISQNAPKHLAYHLSNREFKTLFNRCLYNCEIEQEFQEVWDLLVAQIDLSKNSWLKSLFELQHKWC